MCIKSAKNKLLLLIMGCAVAAPIAFFNYRSSPKQVAETSESAKEAKPLFVLIEYNHWALVIGADTPTFALYDDGTVIFWRGEARGGKYVSARLTGAEVSQILEKISPKDFNALDRRYEPAGGISHAPETLMVLQKQNGSYKEVYSFGSLKGEPEWSNNKAVPKLLVDIYQVITTYDNPKATEWVPDYIEVMVWPYEYAPDKDLVWPKGWSDLSDPKTVKRNYLYSIFIEKSKFEELKLFISNIGEKQAVRMNGKKWAVDVRLPFPDEKIWKGD